MKKIIVCTDFSETAANAVNYAADMALAINAQLLILHTFEYPLSINEVPITLDIADFKKEAENYLASIKNDLSKKFEKKIDIETLAVQSSFYSELKNICEKIKPYAVIIGTQGKIAAERLFLGSHAVQAMKSLQWPLIAIPPNACFSLIKKIGLACDFEKVVEYTPIDEIKQLVNDFKAELHILNTGKKTIYNPDVVFQSGLMQEMLFELKPIYHFIANNDIDKGTLEFAEKNKIDLLIVLPKRHSFTDKLLYKSHTKQFVLHSHIPVMAMHE